jgi:hypothetical protein
MHVGRLLYVTEMVLYQSLQRRNVKAKSRSDCYRSIKFGHKNIIL